MADFSQELKKDFLDEAFELLDNLEKSLLSLEKNLNDDKAINEVFRVVHTIKGGAGTVGFVEIRDLTHIFEDILELVRKKMIVLKSENISLFLECRDELEKMLSSREKDQIFTLGKAEELKTSLFAIKINTKDGQVIAKKEIPIVESIIKPVNKVSHSEDFEMIINQIGFSIGDLSLINDFISHNKNVFILWYDLNESYEMKEVSGFQIYALLNDISEIIKMYPTIEELEISFYKDLIFVVKSDKDEKFIRDKTTLKDMISNLIIFPVSLDNFKLLENSAINKNNAVFAGQTVQETQPSAASPAESTAAVPGEKEKAAPKKEAEPDNIQKRGLTSLRVESWKVDELLNLIGELVITKASFLQLNTEFDQTGSSIKSVLKDFISGVSKLKLAGDPETVKESNRTLFDAFSGMFNSFDNYAETIQKLNRISSALQENVMNMRMVPIQMVFSRFPRLIRDMADRIGKKIELIVEGVETEIDKGIVDDIFDPLIHLLRNAVDHGIETPEERTAAGKPETGKIVLKAVHEGDSIMIEVSDDGKGIDSEVIMRKALEGRFITKDEAEKMSQKDLLNLIFLPGLSTARQVTDISGRGVGMDVVKKKIEEIGGNVALSTARGKGSRIVIRLPLTLAIIQGLLILVNKMHYVIPVAAVDETVIIDVKNLQELNGRLTLELRGKFIPIMSLEKYFYHNDIRFNETGKEYCIVVKYGDKFVGFLINEVLGEHDIVIKPLNTKLIRSPGISAATIIGNGEIGYIIDTSQIISQYFQISSDENRDNIL
jgi:two-component system, chemotaxis family, sensor kinase CheA